MKLVSFLRFRSMQTNMVLAFVLLILMTIVIMSVVSYFLSKDAVQSNAKTYTTELVKQVNNNIRSYVNGMMYISDLVDGNPYVQQYMARHEDGDPAKERALKQAVADFLESMAVSRADISSVSLFGYSGEFVSGNKELALNPFIDIPSLDWYRVAREAGGEYVISPSHVQPVFKNRYPWVVSLSMELTSRESGTKFGIFLIDLNFSVMNDMLQDIRLGQRGYLFIVDSEGRIVYHPQQQLIYSKLKTENIDEVLRIKNGTFMGDDDGNRRMYTVQESEFGWKIVGVSYVSELVGNQNEMRLSIIVLGLVCIVIAIVISLFVSQRVSQPIKQLQGYMKEVEKGNFDIQVPVPTTIEIGRLARAFNMMVGRIKELMSQVVRDQELKRRSEINALQAQINPHFLYNTLDSIIWMAESKKSQEVVLMTSALAKLFRASISKGEELVTIETELEHITNYLKIQKMRYKNKLDYRIETSDTVGRYKTIKLILQPIVENAIYHGIKMKRGPGLITISSEETAADVLLIVEDNGNGMDEEKLSKLLSQQYEGEAGKGVGVGNVHGRLKLYFGPQYGLEYKSKPGEGTTVTIRLPKHPPVIGGGIR
ncbi:cache domain-containing sensor histidine kinase [Paenibacillus harenae]|uniref:cache domain-containing sensor histidine kinase n=1 Tax=Paenibacillus harenae TaxID=306543 RepID=UPI0027930558|nr:sensor histidine kinase [Paenibacillus harenae]MDQ0062307.1 two-component system sensor histidine kinase YesM [Paenibacillus harenae]